MKRLTVSLGFLSLLGLSTLVTAQAAQVPEVLEGDWRSTVSQSRAREIVLAAFRPRLQQIPSIMRGMVEGRIRERTRPTTRIEIALDGDRIRVVDHRSRPVVVETPLGGSTQVTGDDGETRRVTQRLNGGWLEQVFQGDNGTVTRLLSVEPDGRTMHADMTVDNERLGAPVRWRLDYRR